MSHPLTNQGKGNKNYQGMDDVTKGDPVEEKALAAEPETTEETTENTPVSAIVNKISLKPKAEPKVQLTVYIDEEVSRKFATFGDMYGKGSKSELINDFLAEALKDVKPKPKRR